MYLVKFVVVWYSVLLKTRLAVLKFNWSSAGLCVEVPVSLYSHVQTSCPTLPG